MHEAVPYTALALFTAIVICLARIARIAYHPDLRRIPGPFLSRFTNIPLKIKVLSGQRTKYIHSLHEKYGPYVRISPTEISTSDISAHREIHKIGTSFVKAPWYQGQAPNQYDDNTGGVFVLVDPKTASSRRRLFQQAGTRAAVKEWEHVVIGLARQAVEKIKQDATTGKADLFKWWTLMTSDVLSSVAFGEPFRMVEKGEKSQLIHDIEQAMIFGAIGWELPWLWHLVKYIPLPKIGRPADFFERGDKYGEMALRNTKAAKPGSAKTLFSKMVPEDGSQHVPDKVVMMEAANIIVAGSDTTAVALTYLVYAVLSDSEIHRKLLDELNTVSEEPTWEELEGKAYLSQVIQETLRLYAPVPATLPRIAPGGAVLGQYKIPGFVVVGTQAHTFHRDERVFPEPLRFNPDRWADPTAEMKEHFQAFGGMSRVCLGQNVARMELLHATSMFFKECPDVKLVSGTNEDSMDIVDFFVSKPKGGKCEITMADQREKSSKQE